MDKFLSWIPPDSSWGQAVTFNQDLLRVLGDETKQQARRQGGKLQEESNPQTDKLAPSLFLQGPWALARLSSALKDSHAPALDVP